MKENLALAVLKFKITHSDEDFELLDTIIKANADLEAQLELAKMTETHLKSAEKALEEKDKDISILKRALDNRDWKIAKLNEQVEKWQNIVEQKNANLKELAEKAEGDAGYRQQLVAAKKQIQDLQERLSLARGARDNYAALLSESISLNAVEELRKERDRYRAALMDLKGSTETNAQRNMALASAIRSILTDE